MLSVGCWMFFPASTTRGAGGDQVEAKKAEFETWYAGQKTKVAELLVIAKAIEDQIYQANQPKPRSYEVALVK